MKNNILSLFIFVFIFSLFNINFTSAANCASGDLFDSATGARCNTKSSSIIECPKGDLFNTATGERCNTWTENFSNNTTYEFQIGARGESVKAFQQMLANGGFLFGKIDGIYGPITDAAAKNYYKKYPRPLPPIFPPEPTPTPTPTPNPDPKPSPLPLPIVKMEPQISYLSPGEGPVGTKVNIYGTGLSDSTIYFGGYPVDSASIDYSDNGNRIYFVVPTNLNNCYGEQMCTMIYRPIADGKYDVYVTNKNGKSNSVVFVVTGSKLEM